MKVSALIERLAELEETHGDMEVYLDVSAQELLEIGDIDVDAEDSGIIIWKAEE